MAVHDDSVEPWPRIEGMACKEKQCSQAKKDAVFEDVDFSLNYEN